jgi:hypothetical protein
MLVKHKNYILVVKEAHIFKTGKLLKLLETPSVALKRLKQRKELPETILEVALADLEQHKILLEGIDEFNKKDN